MFAVTDCNDELALLGSRDFIRNSFVSNRSGIGSFCGCS